MNLIKSIKKTLFFTLPLAIGLGSCSLPKSYLHDPVYSRIEKSPKKQYLEEKTLDFRDYSSFYQDFDLDGIYDWADPQPYDFGPYIDMNENGIVDSQDIQIRSQSPIFWHHFQHRPFFHSWHNSFFNNHFHFGFHNPSHNQYFWNYNFLPQNFSSKDKGNVYNGPRGRGGHIIPNEKPKEKTPEIIGQEQIRNSRIKKRYQKPKKEYNSSSQKRNSRSTYIPKQNVFQSRQMPTQKTNTQYNSSRQSRYQSKSPIQKIQSSQSRTNQNSKTNLRSPRKR